MVVDSLLQYGPVCLLEPSLRVLEPHTPSLVNSGCCGGHPMNLNEFAGQCSQRFILAGHLRNHDLRDETQLKRERVSRRGATRSIPAVQD